nr:26S proteasome non-ATPase regulatory subunit 10-like [Cherax quadricarinatus]
MDSAFENLIRCSKAGNVEGVVEAVREGAQIDQLVVGTGTTAGPSALHIASTANKLEVVKKLLSLGASVNVVNNFGFTPLHHASEGGNLRVVETLLEAGADPHASNTSVSDKLCKTSIQYRQDES